MSTPAHELFGREAELAEADTAMAAVSSGQPRALVIGGDAGIGKTALASAVGYRAAERGFTVLVGQCLNLDAGVPFAAVRDALRPRVRASLAEGTARPVTARVAGILSQPASNGDPPVALLEDVRQVVGELAEDGPLMLVLEDMHWADRSTQDLAVALARSLAGPVLLVLTYRSDELTRRHPFRKALVEISRGVGAHRIDLAPLDRAGIAGLVRDATGADDAALVGSLLARSEGNPLFVEELLAAGGSGVPGSLADLLLARVDSLGVEARHVLRVASVNGIRLDLDALAPMACLTQVEVEAALREGVDANVLVPRGDFLEFRHGLLQEAVYDDLLPGERVRLHAALATVLQDAASPDGSATLGALGRLAYHWHAAHDDARALAASVQAGLAARRFGAPEAVTHLERVLELWDKIPDPDAVAGVARPDVLCWLALLVQHDNKEERSIRLVREAIHQLGSDPDPLLASRVYSSYGHLCHEIDDVLGQREAVTRALEYAEGEPSEELARALLARAGVESDTGALEPALASLDRCLQVARAAGCTREEVEARHSLGWVLFNLGRPSDGLACYREGETLAASAGLVGLGLEISGDRSFVLMMMSGRVEEGVELALRTSERAQALGLSGQAAFAGEQLADAWRLQGRFDEADVLLEEIRAKGLPHHRWRCMQAEQLLARGDLEAAAVLERETIALLDEVATAGDPFHFVREVDLFAALGDADTVLAALTRFFGDSVDTDSALELALCARGGYAALTAAHSAHREVPPELVVDCAGRLDRALETMTEESRTTLQAGEACLALALARELTGVPAVEQWRGAEAAAAPFGAYHVFRPRLGLASALLANGERDEGRAVLLDVWQSARDMGAGWFAVETARIARRTRVALPVLERLPGRLAALTPREREVLEVLATGATNRQIAERLFISEKTVSVHVTNVLAKFGVSNRGAAASLARELTDA